MLGLNVLDYAVESCFYALCHELFEVCALCEIGNVFFSEPIDVDDDSVVRIVYVVYVVYVVCVIAIYICYTYLLFQTLNLLLKYRYLGCFG